MAKLKGSASQKATAKDVRSALRLRFAAPAWAYFDEVGNATGFGCNRHADGVAMSLWPSRGIELHGIEIKVSRQDWLKELGDPAKAESVSKYLDRWWLAVSDASIVWPGELPPTWGLLVFDDGKLQCKADAPALQPLPLDRTFVAALLRRAQETRESAIEDARREGISEGIDRGSPDQQDERRSIERLAGEAAKLERIVKRGQETLRRIEQEITNRAWMEKFKAEGKEAAGG